MAQSVAASARPRRRTLARWRAAVLVALADGSSALASGGGALDVRRAVSGVETMTIRSTKRDVQGVFFLQWGRTDPTVN
jgi:hypothetical protein